MLFLNDNKRTYRKLDSALDTLDYNFATLANYIAYKRGSSKNVIEDWECDWAVKEIERTLSDLDKMEKHFK